MAYTSIDAVKAKGNKTIAATIRDLTNYITDESKTQDGDLVYCHACDYTSFEQQTLLNKQWYIMQTGRTRPKSSDVLLYHMIQSFEHEEITAEKALEVGKELAAEWTGDNHSYIVAVHTDKKHIHAHIVFDAVNIDANGKFDDLKRSAFHLQKLSDEICLSHGLSIIDNPKVQQKIVENTKIYAPNLEKHLSQRDEVKATVDAIMDTLRPSVIDELIEHLKTAGYDVTERGNNYSLMRDGWKRPARLFSNRAEDMSAYSKTGIEARMAGLTAIDGEDGFSAAGGKIGYVANENISTEASTENKKHVEVELTGRGSDSELHNLTMLEIKKIIDIKNNTKMQESYGYRAWARVHNVTQLAKTFNYMQEVGATKADEISAALTKIRKSVAVGKDALESIQAKIDQATAKQAEIKEAQRHIGQYIKTRDVFQEYIKTGYSDDFLARYEKTIAAHRAAKQFFDDNGYGADGQPLPTYTQLSTEYSKLQTEKRQLYDAKKEIREEIAPLQKLERKLAIIKHNADDLLRHNDNKRDNVVR